VSPEKVSRVDALISYEGISEKASEAIERIRQAVSGRIESGKIKVGRQRKFDDSKEQSIFEHPTVGMLALAETCNAILSDDRFLNQHSNIEDGGARAEIFTTLDLLVSLASTGTISTEEELAYRTLLRRAGYCFVEVREDELSQHLRDSSVVNNRVIESVELRAIRESILHARMSSWLQLPKEALWLDRTIKAFILALRNLWKSELDLTLVKAFSDWILEQVDIRGWVHLLGSVRGDEVIKTGQAAYILALLMPLIGASQSTKDLYWKWVEDRILAPVAEQFPELYAWIIEWTKRQISEVIDMELLKRKAT
jgi:hypothetical protein